MAFFCESGAHVLERFRFKKVTLEPLYIEFVALSDAKPLCTFAGNAWLYTPLRFSKNTIFGSP
jgi:hypothetical protein